MPLADAQDGELTVALEGLKQLAGGGEGCCSCPEEPAFGKVRRRIGPTNALSIGRLTGLTAAVSTTTGSKQSGEHDLEGEPQLKRVSEPKKACCESDLWISSRGCD